MGSINPVIISPKFINSRLEEISDILSGSIMLGAGQFCTNPGLIIIIENENTNNFTNNLIRSLSSKESQCMIHRNIKESFPAIIALLTMLLFDSLTSAIIGLASYVLLVTLLSLIEKMHSDVGALIAGFVGRWVIFVLACILLITHNADPKIISIAATILIMATTKPIKKRTAY